MSTDIDQLDRGLLLLMTGGEQNPWAKGSWNLTRQLLVADQSPEFAATLKFAADHPNPQPTTRCGMPAR